MGFEAHTGAKLVGCVPFGYELQKSRLWSEAMQELAMWTQKLN